MNFIFHSRLLQELSHGCPSEQLEWRGALNVEDSTGIKFGVLTRQMSDDFVVELYVWGLDLKYFIGSD